MIQALLAVILAVLGFIAVYWVLTSASLYLFQLAEILDEQPIPWLQYLVQTVIGFALIAGGAALAAIARAKGREGNFGLLIGRTAALAILAFCVFRMLFAERHGFLAIAFADGPKEIADFWLVIASMMAVFLALFLFPIFRKGEGK